MLSCRNSSKDILEELLKIESYKTVVIDICKKKNISWKEITNKTLLRYLLKGAKIPKM